MGEEKEGKILTSYGYYNVDTWYHGLIMIYRRVVHAAFQNGDNHHHFSLTNLQQDGFLNYNAVKVKCRFCPKVFNVKLSNIDPDDVAMWQDGEAEPDFQ